jgi:hypothetical protein
MEEVKIIKIEISARIKVSESVVHRLFSIFIYYREPVGQLQIQFHVCSENLQFLLLSKFGVVSSVFVERAVSEKIPSSI